MRNQAAPRVTTSLLDGATRIGLLSVLRRTLPLPLFQSALRGLNPAVRFIPRDYLDKVLMPATCPRDGTTVVIVGLRSYATHYSYFYLGHRVIVFDPDPRTELYRGRARFVAQPIRNLGDIVPPETVDLIHCNGVYGWGLDDPREIEASFESMWRALVPGGLLLLGYDLTHHNPLGWTIDSRIPHEGFVEQHGADFPICLWGNQVFRVFQKPRLGRTGM